MSQEDRRPPSSERVVTGRLVRMGDDERAFDDAFWRGIPPDQRVEALWAARPPKCGVARGFAGCVGALDVGGLEAKGNSPIAALDFGQRGSAGPGRRPCRGPRWDMVLDAWAVKGIQGEPRLQRSVGSIRRP